MPDETFIRSMLVRLPEFAAAPRAEMIARFTGGSPVWIEASEPLARFLGKRPADLAGERFHDFLHPDDRALAEDEFRQAAAQGERHDFVLRLRAGDGQWHFLRIHTQARYEATGGSTTSAATSRTSPTASAPRRSCGGGPSSSPRPTNSFASRIAGSRRSRDSSSTPRS